MRCVGTLPLLPPCLPTSDLNTLAFSDLGVWSFFLHNVNIKLLFFFFFLQDEQYIDGSGKHWKYFREIT